MEREGYGEGIRGGRGREKGRERREKGREREGEGDGNSHLPDPSHVGAWEAGVPSLTWLWEFGG